MQAADIVKRLADSDADVRRAALVTLSNFSPAALSQYASDVLKRLEDSDVDVRWAAFEVLYAARHDVDVMRAAAEALDVALYEVWRALNAVGTARGVNDPRSLMHLARMEQQRRRPTQQRPQQRQQQQRTAPDPPPAYPGMPLTQPLGARSWMPPSSIPALAAALKSGSPLGKRAAAAAAGRASAVKLRVVTEGSVSDYDEATAEGAARAHDFKARAGRLFTPPYPPEATTLEVSAGSVIIVATTDVGADDAAAKAAEANASLGGTSAAASVALGIDVRNVPAAEVAVDLWTALSYLEYPVEQKLWCYVKKEPEDADPVEVTDVSSLIDGTAVVLGYSTDPVGMLRERNRHVNHYKAMADTEGSQNLPQLSSFAASKRTSVELVGQRGRHVSFDSAPSFVSIPGRGSSPEPPSTSHSSSPTGQQMPTDASEDDASEDESGDQSDSLERLKDAELPPSAGAAPEQSYSGSRSSSVAQRIWKERSALGGRFKMPLSKTKERRGGQGMVFRMYDTEDGEEVAVKVPRNDDRATHDETRREADLWAELAAHEHVANILYVGNQDGVPLLVLPWATGFNLKEYVEHKQRPLPDGGEAALATPDKSCVCEPIDWALQITFGLQYLHNVCVIHGDVKPSNKLVYHDCRSPTGVVIKICDLGLSLRCVRNSDGVLLQNEPRGSFGTPGMRAPEQLAREQKLTDRCDVWGWAVCLLLCLHGSLPASSGLARETGIRTAEEWRKACMDSVRAACGDADEPKLGVCVAAGMTDDDSGGRAHRELLQLVGRCLELGPLSRPSIQDCAKTLQRCYKELCGHEYYRDMPASCELTRKDRADRQLKILQQMVDVPSQDHEAIAAKKNELEIIEWLDGQVGAVEKRNLRDAASLAPEAQPTARAALPADQPATVQSAVTRPALALPFTCMYSTSASVARPSKRQCDHSTSRPHSDGKRARFKGT